MTQGYLLDTNVVSETRRRQPDDGVMALLAAAEEQQLFISVLTLGELRKGIAAKRVENAAAADSLAGWVDAIEATFADHVLPVDVAVASRWGELSARLTLPVIDTLLAATALTHDLTLITRNVRDVAATGVALANPWRTA